MSVMDEMVRIAAELTYEEAYAFAKVIRRIVPVQAMIHVDDVDKAAWYRAIDKISPQLPATHTTAGDLRR